MESREVKVGVEDRESRFFFRGGNLSVNQQPCMWLIKLDCKIRQVGEPKSSAIFRAKKFCRKLGPQQ